MTQHIKTSAERIALVSSVIRKSRQPAKVIFAMNSHTRVAEVLCHRAFPTMEHVRAALGWGILLSNGDSANGIGQCKSRANFEARAKKSGITILA